MPDLTITLSGWLSFPSFTAAEAYALSQRGQFPNKDVASSAPHFQLLLSDVQAERLKEHLINVFLPHCVEQHKAGEKRNALEPAEVKNLIAAVEAGGSDVYNTPYKTINDKTAALRPDAVACIKVVGTKGVDMDLRAIVNDPSELAVPDPDRLQFPVILPINQTAHQMYAGARVMATIGFYAYKNGKIPGFSASANIVVFKADDERFGGGGAIDEDAMFLMD